VENQPHFSGAGRRFAQHLRHHADAEGIANKKNRVRALQDDWDRTQAVIAERAGDETMCAIPGASTGIVVRTFKGMGGGKYGVKVVEEHSVDVGLLAARRATLKQAAQELNEWVERRANENTGPDGEAVVIQHEHSFDFEGFRQLVADNRERSGGENPRALANGHALPESMDTPPAHA
jgi:hypothetical protein